MNQKRSTLNAQRPIPNSALDVRRWAFDVRLCFDIATKRQQLSPFSVAVVSSFRAPSSLAPDTRPVRHSRLRVHAPTNASRHRLAILQRLAPTIPKFCGVGSRVGGRSATRLAGSWLLQSRSKSSCHRKNRRNSTLWPFPEVDRAAATTSRSREIHRPRHCHIRFRSAGGHYRGEYFAPFITSARFANSDRFDCWTERTLECRLHSHSKKGHGRT